MHNQPHTEEAKAKIRAARLGKPAPWKHREKKDVGGTTLYRCGRCGEFLPASGFYKSNRTLLGLKSQCKSCHVATTIASRDPEKARKSNSEYMSRARAADPEKFRARDRSRKRVRKSKTKLNAALAAAEKEFGQ